MNLFETRPDSENELVPPFDSLAWPLIEAEGDLDTKLNRIIVAITREFGADGATLFLRLGNSDTFVLVAQSGDDGHLPWSSAFKLGQPIAGWVAERKKPLLIEDPAEHPALRGAGVIARRRTGTALVLPICSPKQGALAVLNLSRRPTSKPYGNADLERLRQLGNEVAPAFAHIRLIAQQSFESRKHAFYGERISALFECLRVAVIAFDDTGILLVANQAARKLLKVKRSTSLRWNAVAERLPGSLAQAVRSAVLKPSGKSNDIECSGKTYRISAAKLSGSGVACFIEDISQQIDGARELAKVKRLAEIGQMTAAIAHEIRNPLTSIRGAAQILQGESEVGQARAWGKVIESEADTLNKLCDSFLEFAKPLTVLPRATNLNEVIERILKLSQAEAKEGNVQLSFISNPSLPIIRVDPDRIAQAVRNLVRNALDAMPTGGTLNVSAAIVGKQAEIIVTDSGEGIDKRDMPKLFTPFFTTKPSGTGLGLCNTMRILEAHGGTVKVESKKGETTFTLSIPAVEERKAAA